MKTGNATVDRVGLAAAVGTLLPLGRPVSPPSDRIR
jgi:hypothetical protein